jgi:hypothetical protein
MRSTDFNCEFDPPALLRSLVLVRRAVLLLAFVAVVLPARARLGETEAQTIARYGPPGTLAPGEAQLGYRTLAFDKNGYRILAVFIGPTCELLAFRRPDQSPLDPDEVELMLTANNNGHTWTASSLISRDQIWDRDDGARARYDSIKHVLVVCSAAYLRAEPDRRQTDRQKQLEGF